ncbi:MAG: pilus assembly protein, partial [Nitrosospira sp.]|nr:pilus assembly protein [Nitrosospira sp.]
DATTGLKTKGTIANSADLQTSGGDRRLATVAVIDCAGFTGGSTVAPVQSWACVLMLHPINNSQGGGGTGSDRMYLEYLGRSDDPGSPCATSGLPGGPGSGGPLVPALVR